MLFCMPTQRDIAIAIAWRLYGTPYIYGGNDPDDIDKPGLDCSGFIRYILREVGELPLHGDWTAQNLHNMFLPKRVHAEMTAPGCLAFYGFSDNNVSHVMMCLNKKLAIGAVGGYRDCNTVEEARGTGAKVAIRPINYRTDLVCICDPFGSGE